MNLTVVHPQEQKTYSIAWIEFTTPSGNYVVQKGNAPFIGTLELFSRISYCLATGKQESFEISGPAVIYVERTEVSIVYTPQ